MADDALDRWVLDTAPRAVAYAASLLRDADLAEDIVQECYCRLLARAGVYDLPRDGLKLLMRSVTNACINARTRRRAYVPIGPADGGCDPAGGGAGPADEAAGRELGDAVRAALMELPVTQRAALELKSLGHSQREIAEILQVGESHAGVLVHRARKAMAARLAPHLGKGAVE